MPPLLKIMQGRMKPQVYILIGLLLLAVLISLGGCVTKQVSDVPWMFYQAHDLSRTTAPAPFFLTMREAQTFANEMNVDANNSYQVSFIAR